MTTVSNKIVKNQNREIMLGYLTSIVEGVDDEFINVRENLIS